MAYYFASDTHFGSTLKKDSRQRERLFVAWLDAVSEDAEGIFLVGDIFDFWFEYKRVIPKGFVRLFGKLAELTDRGIPVHFFTGNHDVWAFDYLGKECGVVVHQEAGSLFELGLQRVFVGHGDQLGHREMGARFIGSCFRNRILQWLFSHVVHPDAAMRFGYWWSERSRVGKPFVHSFRGASEPLVHFAESYRETQPVDCFVFGHLHSHHLHELAGGGILAILGEWIESSSYGVLREGKFTLETFQPPRDLVLQ